MLLLCAAGCAVPRGPAPTDVEPASLLARAALAEWEVWGRVVVVGWPAARPANTAATPQRFARLTEYWTVIPGGTAVARRLSDQRAAISATLTEQGSAVGRDGEGDDLVGTGTAGTPGPEDIGLYAYPAWSAAFISAVARRAGVPESDLPSASRHARYIDAMLARAIVDPQGAPFRPYAPEERAPRPGDLVCADRAAVPLAHWSMRLAELGRPRPMHCDVVVRTAPGVVETVGGNVQDLVVLRRLPSDATGRMLPAPPERPPFVLVLAAQEQG